MPEGVGAQFEKGGEALKKNWIFTAVLIFGVMVLVLWYDHKNSGKLTAKLAGLPGIGKLFA